jgi:hypothetical protein
MEFQKKESTASKPVKLIHVQILDATEADVYEIGDCLKRWTKSVENELPYKLHALITDQKVSLMDLDTLLKSLLALRKQVKDTEKVISG